MSPLLNNKSWGKWCVGVRAEKKAAEGDVLGVGHKNVTPMLYSAVLPKTGLHQSPLPFFFLLCGKVVPALLWLPHQPSPYKGWYKLINLIRYCDCGCDYRGWKGREGSWEWKDETGGMESWRWGCAGSQGPGNDEPGGVGEEPRCSAWLMRLTSWIQCSLPFFFVFSSQPALYLSFPFYLLHFT